MFNALTLEQILAGIGRVLGDAARADRLPDKYERGQMLSARSLTKLIAAEQKAAPRILAQLKQEADQALAADSRPQAVRARQEIAAAVDATEIGDVLSSCLGSLPPEGPTRIRIHKALRSMVDREVAALAEGPGE